MHKIRRKKIALLLVLAMLLSFMPQTWASAEEAMPAGSGGETGEVSSPSALEWTDVDDTRLVLQEDGTLMVDGVTYMFSLDAETKTAALTDIANPELPAEAVVPACIYAGDTAYRVTALKWLNPSSSSRKRPNITQISLPDTLETADVYFNKFPNITEITIPGSVRVFRGSFQNCAKLEKIIFAEGVEEICAGLMIYDTSSLREISLPDSLQSISQTATFAYADALETITLPAAITEIPLETFRDCTALQAVAAKGSITAIGKSAFSGCSSLTAIPDLSQVTEMEEYAFYECKSLRAQVDLSSLEEIPPYAFCYTYVSVTAFSDTLKSIGDWALIWGTVRGNEDGKLVFPDTLESIGAYAFYAGNLPETVELPDSVITVEVGAFQKASGVAMFKIGTGLTNFGTNAFASAKMPSIYVENSADNMQSKFPQNATVTYAIASIGDVGDTISDDEDAPTLQQAVDAAENGGTIVVKKNVRLKNTLQISTKKELTISSENEFTIVGPAANSGSSITNLITVAEGASVTFAGNLKLQGNCNSGSVIYNQGKVTLTDNATVTHSSPKSGNNFLGVGVIDTAGAGASFVMQGGILEKNTINQQCSGVVLIRNGATVSIEGGVIQNNEVTGTNNFNSSAGILLYGNSSGAMTGGLITGNKAMRGSAIMLYGADATNRNTFTMSGGDICQNTCKRADYYLEASGAVHIEDNAIFTMTGGSISANIGRMGAGVCVVDGALQKGQTEYKTAFVMQGGKISGNEGFRGGGIYSYSNGVSLESGCIINNKASERGGGVYSEGNGEFYSTLHMEKAIITENTASKHGGGLWFCPTGDGKVYIKNGGVIIGNNAGEAGDDVVSARKFSEKRISLADRMLGGGKVWWYPDGGVYALSNDPNSPVPLTETNNKIPRYDESAFAITVQDYEESVALKAIAVDVSAVALAESKATLLITGNEAGWGGGVAANGGVVIGESSNDLQDIPVKKVWQHGANPETAWPKAVTVKLMAGKVMVDKLVLDGSKTDDGGNWMGTFEKLPVYDEAGAKIVYTVMEEAVDSYKATINQPSKETAAKNPVVLVNTYAPQTGSLTVSKTVSGSGASSTKDFTFTVTLDDATISGTYGDMTFENGIANFTLKADESKTASSLPADVGYTVAESDNVGYTVTVNGTANITATGTITANTVATAAFNNHKGGGGDGGGGSETPQTGSLEISKVVSGAGGDKEKAFVFTVTLDEALSGQYGDFTFHKGVTTVMLKHGESKRAIGLPKDVGYKVTESGSSGYTVTASGENGVIMQGETAHVRFENYRDIMPDEEDEEPDETPSDEPSTDADNPEKPKDGNPPTSSVDTDEPDSATEIPLDDAPKTGDMAPILLLWALLAMSACGFICLKKKKN